MKSAIPLAVAAAAFTVAVGLPAGDPDMWWHLASGRWMVEHRELLRVDIFSSTATGEQYVLGEPLGQVVLWLAYAAGSWLGVALLRAALVAAAAFGITRLALRAAPARVAVPLAAAAILLTKATWTDRPQLWTLALFPIVLDLALAARAGSRAARVSAVALVAVWAELHGGYAVGVGIMWIFALEAVLTRRDVIAPAAAAVVATFVTGLEPGALSLVRALTHVGGSTVRIVEESPVEILTPFGALFAVFVAGTVTLLMCSGASEDAGPPWRAPGTVGDRPAAGDRLLAALVIVPTLWLALSAQRHIPLFGIAVVPFVAGPLARLVDDSAAAAAAAAGPLFRGAAGLVRTRGQDRQENAADRQRSSAKWQDAAAKWQGSPADVDPPASGVPRAEAPGSGPAGERPASGSAQLAASSLSSRPYKDPAGTDEPPKDPPPKDPPPKDPRVRPALAPALAAALWLGALAGVATVDARPDLTPYPAGAVSALAASGGILLNEYDWGGYLIWSVPERPVFVDGRLYPFITNGVMDSYERVVRVARGWQGVIDRSSVAQALLRPDRALVQALRDEGWTTVAEGDGFVLLERPR